MSLLKLFHCLADAERSLAIRRMALALRSPALRAVHPKSAQLSQPWPQALACAAETCRSQLSPGLGLNDVLSKFQHLSGDFHVRNFGKSALFPRSLSPACCAWRLPGGTFITKPSLCCAGIPGRHWRRIMHGIIYLVGLIVVILAVLSFFGLR
jgi:hypothetical protein